MEPFDTTRYEINRKEDGSLVRIFGNGFEEPELTVEQHQANVDYHSQVVANAEAQRDKVAAFELANPAPVVEPEPQPVEDGPQPTPEDAPDPFDD